MSKLVSTSEEICHASTNHSKSKMLFSFPKSSRFPKRKPNQSHKFYNLSTHIKKRSTCFGYGVKSDFTKELPNTPPPNHYEKQTLFDEAKKKNKGYGFGSGRGEMEASGISPQNNYPGPGTYEFTSGRNHIAYSLRTKITMVDKEKQGIPGPGRYESYTTFKCKNFLSKHINKEGKKFQNCDKLITKNSKMPGPGAYDTSKTDLSPEGQYYPSRFETSKSRRFGRELRNTFINRCQTPGPGHYRIPSEFGHYVNSGHVDDSQM